ncbi:MAG TPA: tetratricopeptide repeat protein [Candidatus Polarisedimenticolaceae bacterium]|nr:tetratricopeptide repeat protein [Candidatus Polarisedimenticolaceae bacterium]
MTWRLRAALLVTLAVLLAHAAVYRFLCDDAFISFRYAKNLASGAGLVFNPGGERVEGYTNFLWVVVLAALDRVGLRPEHVAPVLSILLTIVLWGLVVSASVRFLPPRASPFLVVLPAAWMALTRSVAVWSTSGLETRLFEVLTVAGVLCLIDGVAAADSGSRARVPWAAVLLGLAALTRPDGMLIGGAAMAAAGAVLVVRRRLRIADAVLHAGVFGAIVGGHLLFRHAYYGAWLPNTYYAKVGGRAWWGMGGAYVACCALEYAAWLWIPPLVAGIGAEVRERRSEIPLVIGAVIVPHAIYIASIGGDHFEYRPLDLYFPLLFLLIARGLASMTFPRWAVAAYASAIALGLVILPWESHRQFPRDYSPGFPGMGAPQERAAFLDPARDPFLRWPGLRSLGEAHRKLLRLTTSRLAGVRQEEHALFLATVAPEGRRLAQLVAGGTLPADTHIAISAVGAIPYDSNLRVLDRLGLTDAVVAHSAPNAFRYLAHDRQATIEYAAQAGVDLWSEHPVHLLYRSDDDALLWTAEQAHAASSAAWFAETGEGDVIVARLPQGPEKAAARFPRLRFLPLGEPSSYAALLDLVIAAQRARLAREPGSQEVRATLGAALAEAGRDDEAISIFRTLAGEGDAEGWYNLGTILVRRGDLDGGVDALHRALTLDPFLAPARQNLGLALVRAGKLQEAVGELREAVRRDPESERALYLLGLALTMAGDTQGAGECARALSALGTPDGTAYADKLSQAAPAH